MTSSSLHTLPKLMLGLVHNPKPESDPDPDHLPFSKLFEDWLKVQDQDLHDLMAIAAAPHAESTWNSPESTRHVREHVDRVIKHYENYYRDKLESIKENVLLVLTPDWLSKLEDAFLWIGGWRPTIAFHLLYSKVGLQFEVSLPKFLSSGVTSTGDLDVLSSRQLAHLDELHKYTIKEERKLTESLASHQETIADSTMVELSRRMTELMTHIQQDDESTQKNELDSLQERVNTALTLKEHGLQEILVLADELRFKTLKSIVDILSPIQAVHFLIACTQHHLRIHEWGLKKDEELRMIKLKTMREDHGLAGPRPYTMPNS